MNITPTFEVQIWNHDGEVVKVKLIMLTAWAHALKAELKGYQISAQEVAPIVRTFLGCPDDYPLDQLSDYISTSLLDIQKQLGLKE